MFFDEKKAMTTIMGRRKANGERTMAPTPMKMERVMNEGGEVDGKHIAAQEMMAAMKEGSPQKYSEALCNFMDIHKSATETKADAESVD